MELAGITQKLFCWLLNRVVRGSMERGQRKNPRPWRATAKPERYRNPTACVQAHAFLGQGSEQDEELQVRLQSPRTLRRN